MSREPRAFPSNFRLREVHTCCGGFGPSRAGAPPEGPAVPRAHDLRPCGTGKKEASLADGSRAFTDRVNAGFPVDLRSRERYTALGYSRRRGPRRGLSRSFAPRSVPPSGNSGSLSLSFSTATISELQSIPEWNRDKITVTHTVTAHLLSEERGGERRTPESYAGKIRRRSANSADSFRTVARLISRPFCPFSPFSIYLREIRA